MHPANMHRMCTCMLAGLGKCHLSCSVCTVEFSETHVAQIQVRPTGLFEAACITGKSAWTPADGLLVEVVRILTAAADDVLLHRAWGTRRVGTAGTVLMGSGASHTAQIALAGAAAPGGKDLRPGAATAPTATTLPLTGADRRARRGDADERAPRASVGSVLAASGGPAPRARTESAAPEPTARAAAGQGQTPVATAGAAPHPAGTGTVAGPDAASAAARAALRSARAAAARRGGATGAWNSPRTAYGATARSRQGIRRPRRARRTPCPNTGCRAALGGRVSAAQSGQTRCRAARGARSAAGTRARQTGRAR